MNRIEVLAATPAIEDTYEATIDTSESVSPAMLHTTALRTTLGLQDRKEHGR